MLVCCNAVESDCAEVILVYQRRHGSPRNVKGSGLAAESQDSVKGVDQVGCGLIYEREATLTTLRCLQGGVPGAVTS